MPNNQNNLFPQPPIPQSKNTGYIPINPNLNDLEKEQISVPPPRPINNNYPPQQNNFVPQQQGFNNFGNGVNNVGNNGNFNSQNQAPQPNQQFPNPQQNPYFNPNQYPQNFNQQQNPQSYANFDPLKGVTPQPQNFAPQNNQPNNFQTQQNQYIPQPINTDFGIDQQVTPEIETEEEKPKRDLGKTIVSFLKKNLLYVSIGGGLVGFLIVVLVAVAIFGGNSNVASVETLPFNNVTATIDGPKSLPQGTPGKWEIKIRNNEPTAISDLKLEMQYDQDFQLTNFLNYKPENSNNVFKINRLDGVGTGTQEAIVSIEGFLNAQVDIETLMQGKLSYVPAPLANYKNNRRQVEVAGLRTRVTSPEVQLSIAPTIPVVQNGGEAEFVIKVKNIKENDLQDLRLKVDYPAGNIFTYTSSQFTASNTSQKITSPNDGDNIWYISRLAGLSEQTLILKGTVNVKSEQKVALGVALAKRSNGSEYRDLKNAIKDVNVSSQPIIISTSVEKDTKTFASGETLTFNIDYFNQSQDVIKNAQILASVDDPSKLLDLSTVSFTGGNRAYINNSQIEWVGNNTPELVTITPQARGRLTYSIAVKPNVIVNNKSQAEYTLKPQVKIRAVNLQDITVSGDTYKMNSNLRFSQSDPVEVPIQNNTQSNRKRYRVQWFIRNEQSQIDGLEVRAITALPPSAYQSSSLIKPENSTFEYNPTNGEILFKIDKIPAYTGLAKDKPELKVSFDFEIEDSNLTNLLDAPTISAIDNFTGESYNFVGKPAEVN
jgi:hypothetical protein